jgi:hypothetical protein
MLSFSRVVLCVTCETNHYLDVTGDCILHCSGVLSNFSEKWLVNTLDVRSVLE